MKKQCVVIKDENNKPLVVVGVQSVEPSDFIAFQKQAKENLNALLLKQKQKIDSLQTQINDLIKEIKYLKGEDESL